MSAQRDRAALRRQRRAEAQQVAEEMAANTVTVQAVGDWFSNQLLLSCRACSWSTVAINPSMAEILKNAHIGTATHLARPAESLDPST